MAKIRVSSGKLVDPFNITPEDLVPITMIHSICLLNRYHGHSKHPYSVGQHTANLVMLVPPHLKKIALVHDFSEAFFNDVAAPVKYDCPDYVTAEHECEETILKHFDIDLSLMDEFKEYDKRIYINERDYLFPNNMEVGDMGDNRPGVDIMGLNRDMLFGETGWRRIRAELCNYWKFYFPEFELGSMPNVEQHYSTR
jgi:hypothetical protein